MNFNKHSLLTRKKNCSYCFAMNFIMLVQNKAVFYNLSMFNRFWFQWFGIKLETALNINQGFCFQNFCDHANDGMYLLGHKYMKNSNLHDRHLM